MTMMAIGMPAGLALTGALLQWLPAGMALLTLAAILALSVVYCAASAICGGPAGRSRPLTKRPFDGRVRPPKGLTTNQGTGARVLVHRGDGVRVWKAETVSRADRRLTRGLPPDLFPGRCRVGMGSFV
jgi:hypothetical protein